MSVRRAFPPEEVEVFFAPFAYEKSFLKKKFFTSEGTSPNVDEAGKFSTSLCPFPFAVIFFFFLFHVSDGSSGNFFFPLIIALCLFTNRPSTPRQRR